MNHGSRILTSEEEDLSACIIDVLTFMYLLLCSSWSQDRRLVTPEAYKFRFVRIGDSLYDDTRNTADCNPRPTWHHSSRSTKDKKSNHSACIEIKYPYCVEKYTKLDLEELQRVKLCIPSHERTVRVQQLKIARSISLDLEED